MIKQFYFKQLNLAYVICLHTLGKFYPSAEMQSVYSTATTDWTVLTLDNY